jgi:hypothetical protein
MSTTMQRVGSLSRLSLSRGNSVHGANGSVHGGSSHGGSFAALALLNAAGSASAPRTLVLRACPPRARAPR